MLGVGGGKVVMREAVHATYFTIICAGGTPIIGWNTPTSASRTYKVFGKVDLADSVWLEVNDNAALYRFSKSK